MNRLLQLVLMKCFFALYESFMCVCVFFCFCFSYFTFFGNVSFRNEVSTSRLKCCEHIANKSLWKNQEKEEEKEIKSVSE